MFQEAGLYYDETIVCITIFNTNGADLPRLHVLLNKTITRDGIRLHWKDRRDAYLYLQAVHKNYMLPVHQNKFFKVIIRGRVYSTITRELVNNIIKYNIKEIYIKFDSNFILNWYMYKNEYNIEFIVWVFGMGIYD